MGEGLIVIVVWLAIVIGSVVIKRLQANREEQTWQNDDWEETPPARPAPPAAGHSARRERQGQAPNEQRPPVAPPGIPAPPASTLSPPLRPHAPLPAGTHTQVPPRQVSPAPEPRSPYNPPASPHTRVPPRTVTPESAARPPAVPLAPRPTPPVVRTVKAAGQPSNQQVEEARALLQQALRQQQQLAQRAAPPPPPALPPEPAMPAIPSVPAAGVRCLESGAGHRLRGVLRQRDRAREAVLLREVLARARAYDI